MPTIDFSIIDKDFPPYVDGSLVVPVVIYQDSRPLWAEFSLKPGWQTFIDQIGVAQYEYETGKYAAALVGHLIQNAAPTAILNSHRVYYSGSDTGYSRPIAAYTYSSNNWAVLAEIEDSDNNSRIIENSAIVYKSLGDNNTVNLFDLPSGITINNVGFLYNTVGLPDPPDYEYTWNGHAPPLPFIYGPTSYAEGGQGGNFNNGSDSVDFAQLPSGGAAASGLLTMFTPTAAQLQSFGQFLWSTLFDGTFDSLLTSLKKWVNDPIESVIQLSAFPVTPPAGSAAIVKFCGIRSDLIGAGVSMNKCSTQFMDFDFGQLATPAYWKQALDYSPYTQVSIYLPYIGICPLKSDDVIDATLQLKYHIDLLTGGFSAELKVTKNISGTSLSSVLYNWSGNMATQIPITSSNFSQVFGSMMTAVAAIGVGAITGGMGAAAAGGGAEAAASSSAIAGGALSGAGHGLAANIGNVINSKPHVTQSGRLDGTVGALSQFTPYLIIERPVQSLSAKFQEEQGYPSNIVQRLGDLSGLTVCEAPIMTGFSGATEEEKEAIRALLCGGVIL